MIIHIHCDSPPGCILDVKCQDLDDAIKQVVKAKKDGLIIGEYDGTIICVPWYSVSHIEIK